MRRGVLIGRLVLSMRPALARAAVGWGVRELAERANITPNTVSRIEKGGAIKLKLHDKQAALVNCGRHLGMFVDRVDLSANVTFNINLGGDPGEVIEGEAVEVPEIEHEEPHG